MIWMWMPMLGRRRRGVGRGSEVGVVLFSCHSARSLGGLYCIPYTPDGGLFLCLDKEAGQAAENTLCPLGGSHVVPFYQLAPGCPTKVTRPQ